MCGATHLQPRCQEQHLQQRRLLVLPLQAERHSALRQGPPQQLQQAAVGDGQLPAAVRGLPRPGPQQRGRLRMLSPPLLPPPPHQWQTVMGQPLDHGWAAPAGAEVPRRQALLPPFSQLY